MDAESPPRWRCKSQLSHHLAQCQTYLVGNSQSGDLEVAVSVRLDASWRSGPKTLRSLGRRRSVVSDIDTVVCAGCSCEILATDCYEATSNPFSTARCMLVCAKCRNVLNDHFRMRSDAPDTE